MSVFRWIGGAGRPEAGKAVMHPIERLRFVARASGADQRLLVQETAGALASFGFDPPGLVTACRQIVARHPTAGSLWWLASRALTAQEPVAEVWRAAAEIDDDPTVDELSHALPSDGTVGVLGWPGVVADALPRRGDVEVLVVDVLGEGSGLVRQLQRADVEAVDVAQAGLGAVAAGADLLLVEAAAVGPDALVAVAGSRAAAAVARHAGTPVWGVVPVGRLLPGRLWDTLTRRLDDQGDPWDLDEELVPLDLVDRLVGPAGPEPVADGLRRTDCPIAPELFRTV
ncbi:hypothetical protein BH20ACT2_BH20ACT2_12360 [soil metagenome]